MEDERGRLQGARAWRSAAVSITHAFDFCVQAYDAISPGHPALDLTPAQSPLSRNAHDHFPAAEWLWLAITVLLGLAVRLPFFQIPMLADEGGYAYATRGWVEGTGRLYGDLWISRPQGIFFVYAGILDLFGSGTIAFRFAAWIAIALTTVAVWGFARLWIGPRAGLVSAFIFPVLSGSPSLEGYTANAEMFMGFPAALAALWLLHASRTEWRPWQLQGIGLLIGVTTSLKPAGAVMYLIALAYIWLMGDVRHKRELLRRSGHLSAGVALVAGLSLLHGWYLGWSDFIYATFTYRLTAQSTATVGLDHNLQAIGRLALRSWNLLSLLLLTGLLLKLHKHRGDFNFQAARRRLRHVLSPGNVRAAAGPLRKKFTQSWQGGDGELLLRLWIVGSLLGVSIGGDWWPHYLIQMAAPLAIWLGVSSTRILHDLSRAGRRVVSAVFVALLIAPFWVLVLGSPQRLTEAMFSHPGYPAQQAVATYIQEHTRPGTTIYVAFDQASIYYLADRPPAYRHLYDQELRGIPSSYSEIITVIQGPNRPAYIVGTRQPGPFPDNSRAFWHEVGNYYVREITIDGVPIYRDASMPR